MTDDPVRVEIFLDDDPAPIGSYRPPASFELDTMKLPDGPHRLTIRATDGRGVAGVRVVEFMVRNGPGIAVVGINSGDIVEGRIPILVNAFGGGTEKEWEPARAETPAPVPTWAWVLFLAIVSWSMFYWADNLQPDKEIANSPTFASASQIALAAGIGLPAQPAKQSQPGGAAGASSEAGARIYREQCAVCHLAGGEGLRGFVATLRGNPRVLADDPGTMLRAILDGVATGSNPRSNMPGYATTLRDEEIAAVANFLRTSWGHNASAITPEQVRAARQSAAQK